MPHMKRRMVPGMMAKKGLETYRKKGEKMQNKGAKALVEKFKKMGIVRRGNGEKLLQAAMGNGEGIDLSAVAETSMQYGYGGSSSSMPKDVTEMRYGGATTYSGPSKSKKKRKKGRKK